MNTIRRSRRRRLVGLTLAAMTAATACGSTVDESPRGGRPSVGDSNLGGPIDSGSGAPSVAVPGGLPNTASGTSTDDDLAAGTGSPDGGRRGSSIGPAPSSSGSSTSPGSAAGGRTQGPGVTATEVRIGVTYFANKDEANAAIGAPGVTSSDGKKNAQAVIDDINARGGVAGRKLVPIFHAFDSQSAETRDTQDRAACARFTEDNQVFAVAGSGVGDELAACLTKAGVIQVDSGVIIGPDRVFFSQHPDYVNIGTLTQDRMMAALVPTLVRMTYFSGWDVNAGGPGSAKPKVGVLSLDVPEWERPLTKVLLPALARAGHSVAPEHVFRAHNPASPAEFGDTFSGMQGATLRFSSDGVTHVIMLDPTGSLTMIFTTYAKNQRYYPRLGINSGSGMQSLVSGGVVEAKHFTGAVGLGWLPALDLPAADGDRYATGETKRCIKVIEERSGQTFTSTNAASGALAYCDQINLIAAAVNGAGRVINRSTGRTAIEALGSRFPAAGLPAAFLSANRHDAAELGFDLAWDEACPCARYRGEGRRIL